MNGSRNVYNDFGANDVIAWSHTLQLSILALLSPTSYSLSRWTRNCVTRLVAHLRVAWAQCVYDYYFPNMPYYRRHAITLQWSSHYTSNFNCIKICGARRCLIINTPSGAVTLTVGDSTSGTAMYEPNQFCMNCGIVDDNAGPIRFSSPIGRNLNDGDSIILLVRPNTTQSVSVQGTVRYAITLQWSSHYTSNSIASNLWGP